MYYLIDYHIHTSISPDGKDSIIDVCESAISKGLKEIVITEHCEMHRKDWALQYYDLKRYKNEILEVREKFKGKVEIKTGIELGQPYRNPKEAKNIIKFFPYDYIIGSLHKMPNNIDVGKLDLTTITLDKLCLEYLKQLAELVRCGMFDCVGHLDLIKRYSTNYYKQRITLIKYYDLLVDILKNIIENGKGIEINTSGLRQAPKETMPGLDVIKLYKNLGGEIITIGSDSHNKNDVGKNVIDALRLCEEAGFKHVTTFNNREPYWKKIYE